MKLTDEQIDAILTAAAPAYRAVSPEHAPAWRRKARSIYAAAMRDAAEVARENSAQSCENIDYISPRLKAGDTSLELTLCEAIGMRRAADNLATAIETIAKETDSAGN